MEATKVKETIERALADGCLSRQESQSIKRAMYADGKVSPEECELWRQLQDKIWKGEIYLDS
ncbi:MAG: hypothetical protein J7647_16890 [Cyanobacteria bacterium SBLK]|nr:hypothetical protein [Cyanobacteria bacterium SBLK]